MAVGRQAKLHLVALAAFLAALYLPLIGKGFVLDDFGHVYVTQFESVRFGLLHASGGPFYAPLAWVTFKLDWLLFGAHPYPWAATNLALHIANTLLLYLLAWRLWQSLAVAWCVAFAFALLFPANTDIVIFVSTRAHLLAAFFYLAAMLATLWLLSAGPSKLPALATVLALAALAIFSKESGVTVIGAIALILLYERTRGRKLAAAWVGILFAGLFAEAALYLVLRARSAAIPLSFDGGPCQYTASFHVFSQNLAYHVSRTYGWLLLTAITMACYFFLTGRRFRLPPIAAYDILFSVVLFASAAAPFLLLVERPHYCYLPAIGASLALSQLRGFAGAPPKPGSTLAALVPIGLVVAFCVVSTLRTARIWTLMATNNNSVLAQIAARQPAVQRNTFVVLNYSRNDRSDFAAGFGQGAFAYALRILYRDPTVDGLIHLEGTPYSVGDCTSLVRFRYVAASSPLLFKEDAD